MMPEPVRIVEAALFSAGKPLSVDEIAQATKLPTPAIQEALKGLQKEYAGRETALEVVKSGSKWAMAVRAVYTESTRMLAEAEIPKKVLKTLALIAFHQPVKQSDLKDMVGSVVYDHVHELRDRGMVTGRQEGITKILTTTDRFVEYFGIDAADRDEVRRELARRVGLDLPVEAPAEDDAQARLPDGEENAQEDDTAPAPPADAEDAHVEPHATL